MARNPNSRSFLDKIKDLYDEINKPDPNGKKIVLLVSQTGTDDPVVEVVRDDMDAYLGASRLIAGSYDLSFKAGTLVAGKTVVNPSTVYKYRTADTVVTIYFSTDNSLGIFVKTAAGAAKDGGLTTAIPIEITVYP